MATKTTHKLLNIAILNIYHAETVDLSDNNVQYNQQFLMHATDGILLKLLREFQLLKEKHTKNIKSQMTSKEIRKAITNRSRLF